MRSARHKSLCFLPYLLLLGVPAPRCVRGNGNTRKYGVIVRELRGRTLLFDSCPVAQMNQSNTPYLLRPFFYELGHFHGDGLLPVVSGLLRQQKRATNSGAYWAAFP